MNLNSNKSIVYTDNSINPIQHDHNNPYNNDYIRYINKIYDKKIDIPYDDWAKLLRRQKL